MIHNRKYKLLIVALLCIIYTNAFSQNLDSLLSLYQKEGSSLYRGEGKFLDLKSNFNGAVLVAKHDKVIFKKTYGWYNRDKDIPLQIDSKFQIGSVTKPFTALLVLQMVEKGVLSLEQSVADILPYFPKQKGDKLTIHRLLSNTSGLPHYSALMDLGLTKEDFFQKAYTPEQYAKLIGDVGFINQPGRKFYYSSLGFQLLGVILEEVTGQTYDELLKQHITSPLGLKNTGYSDNDFVENHVAKDCNFEDYLWGLIETFEDGEFRDQSTSYAAGGIHSTVEDLYIWSHALRSHKLLSKELTQKMFTTNKTGYCYGWFRNPQNMLERNPAAKLFLHSGGKGGFSTYIALYDDSTTIIVCSNVGPINIQKVVDDIYREVHFSNPMPERLVLPSLRNLKHFESDEEGGLPGLKKYFQVISASAGYAIFPIVNYLSSVLELFYDGGIFNEAYDDLKPLIDDNPNNEGIINQVAYMFLRDDKTEQALHFFQQNTTNHANAANVYDGLGDGYAAKGEHQLALKNYKIAVELGETNFDSNLKVYQENIKRMEKKFKNK